MNLQLVMHVPQDMLIYLIQTTPSIIRLYPHRIAEAPGHYEGILNIYTLLFRGCKTPFLHTSQRVPLIWQRCYSLWTALANIKNCDFVAWA